MCGHENGLLVSREENYFELVYFVTAFVPSLTACFRSSPGRASLATFSKRSLTNTVSAISLSSCSSSLSFFLHSSLHTSRLRWTCEDADCFVEETTIFDAPKAGFREMNGVLFFTSLEASLATFSKRSLTRTTTWGGAQSGH